MGAKTLVQMEKRIDEARRREEESAQREQMMKQSIAKWQLESDGLHAVYLTEKRHLQQAREEVFKLQGEQHRAQEEMHGLLLYNLEGRAEMDTVQRHLDHQVSLKLSLEQEVHCLQDASTGSNAASRPCRTSARKSRRACSDCGWIWSRCNRRT